MGMGELPCLAPCGLGSSLPQYRGTGALGTRKIKASKVSVASVDQTGRLGTPTDTSCDAVLEHPRKGEARA